MNRTTLLPEELARLLDRLHDAHELAWNAASVEGERPRIEDAAAEVPQEVRGAVIHALIELEVELRRDAQEELTPAAYLGRFPDHATFINTLFLQTADAAAGTLPGYRLIRRIGGGGMGDVFLAQRSGTAPERFPERVAVKTIRPHLLTDPLYRRVMENDILIASAVRNPHIVPILEVGPADGPLYYVMPYMHGGSLAQRIGGVPVSAKQAAELLLPVARAVAHLHAQPQPIVHLDLKPANVLLDAAGVPYLADFGLARLLGADGATLVSQGVNGTPEYMAPEQIEGRIGKPCDVYGLGAILYELLTGRPPFRGATLFDTLRQVQQQEVVPPRELNRQVDNDLQGLCLKCLSKTPEHRYPSVDALVEDLERYLAGEKIDPSEDFWSWLRRQLDRAVLFEPAREWSRLMGLTVVASVILHGLMFAMRDVTDARLFWAWNVFGNLCFEWIPWLSVVCRRRLDPREREMLLFWLAVSIGRTLLFAQFCPLTGDVSATEVYRYYPAVLILYGVMLFVEGRLYWGKLYLIGMADFVFSLVLTAFLPWAPLLFCVWHVAALLVIARHMRKIAVAHDAYIAQGLGTLPALKP